MRDTFILFISDEDDKCRTGVAECRTNFICQDGPGSYECVCDREGYELRENECIGKLFIMAKIN